MPDGTLVAAEEALLLRRPVHEGAAPAGANVPRADRDSVLLNVAVNGRTASGLRRPGRPGRVRCAGCCGAVRVRAAAFVILLVRNQNVPARGGATRCAHRRSRLRRGAERRASSRGGRMRPTLGASPLFPLSAAAEGRGCSNCSTAHGTEVYVLNTWRVGGPAERAGSRKIKPRASRRRWSTRSAAGRGRLGAGADARVRRRRADGVDRPPERRARSACDVRATGPPGRVRSPCAPPDAALVGCAAHLGDFSASLRGLNAQALGVAHSSSSRPRMRRNASRSASRRGRAPSRLRRRQDGERGRRRTQAPAPPLRRSRLRRMPASGSSARRRQ